MKLFLQWKALDDTKYSLPVVYPNKEDLINDFMYVAREAIENKQDQFEFFGVDFDTVEFFYKPEDLDEWIDDPPTVLTIDEYFEEAIKFVEDADVS